MIRIPHLETDITMACQLSCVACNHHVPLYRHLKGGPPAADPKQVEKDLFTLSQIVHADAWGALGGEPLLHSKLVDILKIAKASGIADTIEVWTNGLILFRQPQAFWRSVDRIVFSRYPDKHNETSVAWIVEKCKDEDVELRIMDEGRYPNFKTLFEPVPTNESQTMQKFHGCFFRQFSRVANNGFFFTCCCAPHMPLFVNQAPFGTDGIAIEGLTEQGLKNYLLRLEPLSVCKNCAGRDTAQNVTWHEQKDPAAWARESAGL